MLISFFLLAFFSSQSIKILPYFIDCTVLSENPILLFMTISYIEGFKGMGDVVFRKLSNAACIF